MPSWAVVHSARSGGNAWSVREPAGATEQLESDLEVFVRERCLHCEKAKVFLAHLQQRYPRLTITIRDISEDQHALLRLKT